MSVPRGRTGHLVILLLLLSPLPGWTSALDDLTQGLWNVFRMDAGRVRMDCQVQALALPGTQPLEFSFQTRADCRFFWRLEGLLHTALSPLSLCALQQGDGIYTLLAGPDRPPWTKIFESFEINAPPRRGLIGTRRLQNRRRKQLTRSRTRPPRIFRNRVRRWLGGARVLKARRATYFLQPKGGEDWFLIVLDETTKLPRRIRWGRGLGRSRTNMLCCKLGTFERRGLIDRSLPLSTETFEPWDESTGPSELLAFVSERNLSFCNAWSLVKGGLLFGAR